MKTSRQKCSTGNATGKGSELPILMCGEMVRATLEDRKTETRRVLSFQPEWEITEPGIAYQTVLKNKRECEEAVATYRAYPDGGTARHAICGCPYGVPGDRLWVRETFCDVPVKSGKMGFIYKADGEEAFDEIQDGWDFTGPWKPSIHMPRWASRITLEITGLRVERVQEITEEDAKAEGVNYPAEGPASCYRKAYRSLWNSINSKREGGRFAWEKNPWVWVIQFKRIK